MSIKLKLPVNPVGYASPNTGIGKVYKDAVHNAYYSHEKISSRKNAETLDKTHEVKEVNWLFDDMRKDVASALVDYLIENDGVIDAWPDPDSGLTVFFTNKDGDRDWDAPDYRFNYFGAKYYSQGYEAKQSSKPVYRNPYKYKDLDSVKKHYSDMNNAFFGAVNNSPAMFAWEVFKRFLIVVFMGGAVLSTLYMIFLQFIASDPQGVIDTVSGFVSGFLDKFVWLEKLPFPLNVITNFFGIALLVVPGIYILLPQLIFKIFGKSIVVTLIAAAIILVGSAVITVYVVSFFEGRLKKVDMKQGFEDMQKYRYLKTSGNIKEEEKRNDQLRKEYTQLAEEFHQAWFDYVSKHQK